MPWCPKHGWEFSWEGTKSCPACGSPLVAERPAVADSAAAEEGTEASAPTEDAGGDEVEREEVTGASRLGSFDRLAAPVLLDLLVERGIRAFEAPPLANPATRAWNPMGVDVWVDTARLPEARAIAEGELPALLSASSIVRGAEPPEESGIEPAFDGSFAAEPSEMAEDEEDFAEDEEAVEGEADEAPIEYASFGWMELAPARIFLEVCDEAGIPARTEFPLDGPPPPWAADYGRVSVEVERFFVAEAEEMLATVEERLVARGIDWTEPLCDLAGP